MSVFTFYLVVRVRSISRGYRMDFSLCYTGPGAESRRDMTGWVREEFGGNLEVFALGIFLRNCTAYDTFSTHLACI